MKTSHKLLVVLLLAIAPACIGCDQSRGGSGTSFAPHFSPDLRYLICVQADRSAISGSGKLQLMWYPLLDPDTVYTVDLGRLGGPLEADALAGAVHMVFSPSGRRVAVVLPRELSVIDLGPDRASARMQVTATANELISAVAWISESDLRYVSHRQVDEENPLLFERTFWQYRLGDRPGDRTPLYRERLVATGANAPSEWPIEKLSPDGRYAIFPSPYRDGRFRLLDLPAARIVSEFGRADGPLASVSWKPDSSAAFCVGGSFPPQAVMVTVPDGQEHDFTPEFMREFGQLAPKLPPRWTADGKWLIVNDLVQRGCLVQLEPWRVITTGLQLLAPDVVPEDSAGFLYPLAVPGWVASWNADMALMLSDYFGRRYVPLTSFRNWTQKGWAVSSDGRTIAMVHVVDATPDVGPHHSLLVMPVDLSPPPGPGAEGGE